MNLSISSLNGSGKMFDQIAYSYDRLNRMLSLGLDIYWRKQAIASLNLTANDSLLDIATGTADLILEASQMYHPKYIVGLDPSLEMLKIAQQKILAKIPNQTFRLFQGDAQELPFKAQSFDAISLAFGIRNIPDRKKALLELKRVLKQNGRAVILELSKPTSGTLQVFTTFYIEKIVPWIGSLFSKRNPYDYLQKSIQAFPSKEEFISLLQDCGLKTVHTKTFIWGVCQMFVIKNADALS